MGKKDVRGGHAPTGEQSALEEIAEELREELEEVEEEQQEERLEENKLGTMPVGKLLASMSVPIIISMLVSALYNVVDSIFVARLSEDALAAVGLVFPVQNLMIAVAVGTGVGVNSLLGRRLGEKNVAAANKVAVNGVFLTVVSWAVFAVLALVGTDLFIGLFTRGPDMNPTIAEMAGTYMRIVTIGSFGMFMAIIFERLLQATGRTIFTMVSQMTGAIVNIILDPIMIFGLFGFPEMGVAGAALATIIGQYCSMIVAIWANVAKNKELRLKIRGFRPSGMTIRNIYKVGLPSIVMQSIGSVMVSGMNLILGAFGTTAISVFSVYFKLQSFIFMPIIGLNNGMVPIIAFNYGAQNRRRIERTIRLAAVVALCIMVAGTIVFWAIPGPLLRMFDAQEAMMTMGTQALRSISLCFPFAAIGIVFSGTFQALGQGVYSLIMSVVRQLVFLLPLAWILSRIGGLQAVWYSFPLAELVCIVLAVFLFRRAHRQIIAPLPAGQA